MGPIDYYYYYYYLYCYDDDEYYVFWKSYDCCEECESQWQHYYCSGLAEKKNKKRKRKRNRKKKIFSLSSSIRRFCEIILHVRSILQLFHKSRNYSIFFFIKLLFFSLNIIDQSQAGFTNALILYCSTFIELLVRVQ